MKSFFCIIICASLIATALSAATEKPAGQVPSESQTTTTTAPPTTAPPTSAVPTTTPSAASTTSSTDQTASAPATADSSKDANTTASMAVSSTQDHRLSKSSFTCYDRPIGYYADVDLECKVYHFCLLGEYNGESVYQRISYLCLNESVFDQQALDCVETSKLAAPCKESASYYNTSNSVLREAIIHGTDYGVLKAKKTSE